jgi:hypothetical protein
MGWTNWHSDSGKCNDFHILKLVQTSSEAHTLKSLPVREKQLQYEVNRSPPTSTIVKHKCRYTYNPPCVPSCHVQELLYFYLGQTEGQFYVTSKYFIAMDKSKLSEPVKGQVRLLKSNQIYELISILKLMCQRGTVQLRSRRKNTVKKLNPSHFRTRAFTLAQWLYRCSSVQVAYSPSSPTASKSDNEQSKFYTPFYSARIKHDLPMQSKPQTKM